ncbi:MAG TPA: ATP-binding protein [Thermoleophilaceae bacterium]|nr:ATP-binding protein [Thermoleophilaceae bacterium]
MARKPDNLRSPSGRLFPTDSPVPAGQLIGRRDDIAEIATRLEAGTHLVVAGPRRTGKTSVCEAALSRVARRGAYTARLDLFRLSDAGELAEAIAAAVIANRSATHRALRRARSAGRAALSAAQARAVLKMVGELGEGVELALTPGLAAQDPERALDLALELPERVAVADGKQLILFFDEFQELASARKPYGDPEAVTNRMRAVFQRSTSVSYLFAGSIEHVMRDLFAPSRRAFSGFGSFYSLRPIEAHEWRAGLAARFAEDDCTVADAALARIVELGGGHPRATMRIAQQTHLVSLELGTREIGLDLVQLGFERALEGDRPTMEQVVERIRLLHKHAFLIARTVAAGNPMPRRVQPGARDRALKLLRDAGILEHEAHGRWRVIDPLLRHYLASLDPLG